MTVGNYREILGTDSFDSLTGGEFQVIYGLEAGDSLVSNGEGSPDRFPKATILVGGGGDNIYSVRNNSSAIIIENSGSDDNILFTTILASGIDISEGNLIVADLDSRHLFLSNFAPDRSFTSNQTVILIDWQEADNQIETFDFASGELSYLEFSDSYQELPGYQGNISWEDLNTDTDIFNDGLNQIIKRSQELEGVNDPDDSEDTYENTDNHGKNIGNFEEVLGTDGNDSISGGADLEGMSNSLCQG